MGNCLVLDQEREVIKIMRMDGEILEYQSTLSVQQVLDEFPGHAIADELPALQYLDPANCMKHGQLYYLLLLPPKMPVATERGGIRVKMIVTKQELKELLSKGGFSHGDMVSLLRREERRSVAIGKERKLEWKPTLERIPEGINVFFS
ncbi:hypothetical protein Cni_G06031 [Canna indica]|uniref:Uncharacterized protein n=1 Tax=Canna indica TaxID=4628 RepID=A0AAQ3JWA7_9LILI|nr:hypothetical protein Cni_G06031 [Canna indica]